MKKSKKSDVKIRYSTEELNILKDKANKSGKTLSEYQKEISKKAKVSIEIRDE